MKKNIKPQDFLDMDMSEVMDWLQEHPWDFAIVPREPTKGMGAAFERSINEHGVSVDDQWEAMINAWEESK